MEQRDVTRFIFFLLPDDSLPRAFYQFDSILKELGFMLIPVKIDQLQAMTTVSEQNHLLVLCSITSFRELKAFNDKARSLLKFILKSKRITFIQLSSFSKIDDSRLFSLSKNYFFLRYPLDALSLCRRLVRFYELKSEQKLIWPGGRRAGLGTMNG